jgi:competence protein ComEC
LPANHIKNFTPAKPADAYITARIITDPVVQPAFYGRHKTAFTAQALGFGKTQIASCGLFNLVSYDDRDTALEYGDVILIKGALSRPRGFKNPGCFDYERYLARQGVYSFVTVNKGDFIGVIRKDASILSAVRIFRFKRRLIKVIDGYITADEADILRGVLLGDRSLIEKDLKDKFVKTGTVHILVVSGLNVGLVAFIFLLIFKLLRLPRWVFYPATCLLVAFYAVLTGANPPVVRSAVMAIAVMAGILFYRHPDMLNCLGLSGIVILLKNPYTLFDPGFQLSFAAVIAIIVFEKQLRIQARDSFLGKLLSGWPALASYLGRPGKLSRASEAVCVSLAAWLGIIPIIAYNFNIISPVCILANIPVVFLVFLITAGGMAFLAAGLSLPFLAGIFAAAVEFLTYIMIKTVVLFSKVPFGFFWTHRWNSLEIIGFYAALFVFGISLYNKKISKKYVAIFLLVFLNIFIWQDLLRSTNYELRITVLDVGHGDAVVVEFPGAGCALIDTGSARGNFDIGEDVIGPYLRSRRIDTIDAVFITHPDTDHAGGLQSLLNNFNVRNVFDAESRPLKRFDRITAFNDTEIVVLNPPVKDFFGKGSDNDNSAVLKITARGSSFLLCADIQESAMKELLRLPPPFLKSDVVKLPHHGSAAGAAIEEDFLKVVSPKIALVSASPKDVSASLMSFLSEINCRVYATYSDGAIIVKTAGRDIEVQTQETGRDASRARETLVK